MTGHTAVLRACFVAAFVVSGFLARLTTTDQTSTALVWPAAGVAVLWLLWAWKQESWWPDVAGLAALSFVVNWTTGASAAMALFFVLANLSQAMITVWLLQRPWAGWPRVRWGSQFRHPRALIRLVLAGAAACVPSAVLGMVGLWLNQDFFSVPAGLTWWGRNLIGIVGVVATGLLILDADTGWPRQRPAVPVRKILEAGALLAVTAVLVVVDLQSGDLPLAFFLPALAVWAGTRFAAPFVAIHALISGIAAIAVTLTGHGPFHTMESVYVAALLSQIFVGMTLVLGLVLTMARQENLMLTADVRAARDESQRRAEVLRTIIMSMSDPVVVVDGEDRISLANRAAARLALPRAADPRGLHLSDLALHRPDGHPIPAADLPTVRARAGHVARADVRLQDGGQGVTHRLTATALGGEQDGGVVMVFHDITDERAHQQALGGFASTVAHNLLNPIAAVRGWVEILEEEHPSEEVAHISRLVGRMTNTVNDLLADARARDLTVSDEAVDVAEVVREAAEGVPGAVVKIGEIPPVNADRSLLCEVMSNVISNSMKYVDAGRTPDITVEGHLDSYGDVVVAVADRGIGVPEEHLDAIFEPFYRVRASDQPGSGLGLAICRRIIERHGGRIIARNRDDGPGTVVEMTLPSA